MRLTSSLLIAGAHFALSLHSSLSFIKSKATIIEHELYLTPPQAIYNFGQLANEIQDHPVP